MIVFKFTSGKYLFCHFSLEACHWLPITNGARLVIASWVIVCLIVLKSYEGTLIALMTIPKVEIPFDTLEEMLDQDMPWRFEKYTYAYERLQVW